MAAGGSKIAVVSALAGNSLVMVAKFTAFAFTGSGAMLSEGIHTAADVLNQLLLLIGVVQSEKTPDHAFPYGYTAERYVWALISAVGIFFLGCGVTVYHGINQLLHLGDHGLKDITWAIGVLIISLIIEGFVLWVAVRAARKQAAGKPFFKFLREEADIATVAVILEDAAACLGVIIAMTALVLAKLTGEHYWDAIGSLAVGALLGGVAIWLIAKNRSLLVGPSVPPHVRAQVMKIIQDNPAVEEVVDLRSRVLDTNTYRIKADVQFSGEKLSEKLAEQIEAAYPNIKTEADFKNFAKEYADDVIELLADEIDTIEKSIRDKIPQAEHLDLEAD